MNNSNNGVGKLVTKVTVNPNGTITKKESYPYGVFTTTYNPNLTVKNKRGTINTIKPNKKRGGYKRRRTRKK